MVHRRPEVPALTPAPSPYTSSPGVCWSNYRADQLFDGEVDAGYAGAVRLGLDGEVSREEPFRGHVTSPLSYTDGSPEQLAVHGRSTHGPTLPIRAHRAPGGEYHTFEMLAPPVRSN
jgi:hypothetical protein